MTGGGKALDIQVSERGVTLWIHVTPRARRPGVGGLHDGALRVGVVAPPAEGRANLECRRALARALGVSPGAVEIEAGARGRRKRVSVAGPGRELAARLSELAEAKE